MASHFLPSFISGWGLPSFSAAYSLSSALQRRLLFYLLKRVLGHLVVGGQLDLDQIDLGIVSGDLEVRNVQLDAQAINKLLPAVPVELEGGQVALVHIKLPLSNLRSGEVRITLSGIALRTEAAKAWEATATDASALQETLAASFISAASEVLDADDEGRAIEQSIHESLLEDDLELDPKQKEEVEAGSVISSFIESLLTRLKICVRDVRVDFKQGSTFTLRIAEIDIESKVVDPSTSESSPHPSAGASPTVTISEVLRTATVKGVQILVSPGSTGSETSSEGDEESRRADCELAHGPFVASIPAPPATRTIPGSFGGDDEQQDSAYDARVDPRLDMVASVTSDASASMYESALGETQDASMILPSTSNSGDDILTDTTPAHPYEEPGDAWRGGDGPALLFSSGADAITMTLTTRKEKMPSTGMGRNNLLRVVRSSITVEVVANHLAGLVFPSQVCAILDAAKRLSTASRKPNPSPASERPKAEPLSASETRFELKLHVKSLNVIGAYEDVDALPSEAFDSLAKSLDAFWLRPVRCHPDVGHVRLKVDGIAAIFSTQTGTRADAGSASLSLADLGIFEYLPAPMSELLDAGASRSLPILVLDHNLMQASEPATPTRGIGMPTSVAYNGLPLRERGVLEAWDWRLPASHHASPASATSGPSAAGTPGARFAASDQRQPPPPQVLSPYAKAAYGERGWKVRPVHHRSPSSEAAGDGSSVPPVGAISVNVVLPSASFGQRVHAKIAPVHVFLDLSLVTRLLPSLKRIGSSLGTNERPDLSATVDLSSSTTTMSGLQTGRQPHYGLLDDLDGGPKGRSEPSYRMTTDAIRLELRVPRCSLGPTDNKNTNRVRHERALGLATRSGIFVLEASKIEALFGPEHHANEHGRSVHFAPSAMADRAGGSHTTGTVLVEQIAAFHKPPGMSLTRAFACIGSIADIETDLLKHADDALLPRIQMLEVAGSVSKKSKLDCHLPSLHVCLDKVVIDSLQYLADDLTQWPSQWAKMHLADDDSFDSDGLKILGSRFFGTRAGLSVMSTSTNSTATIRNSPSMAMASFVVSEAVVRLRLAPGGRHEAATQRERELKLSASEIKCRLENDRTPNSSLIAGSVLTFSLVCQGQGDDGRGDAEPLVGRTTEPDLTRAPRPMLSITIEAFSEAGTSYRESSIDASVSFITVRPPIGSILVDDIRALLQAPEGVFEHVEPNEVTRIALKVRDCSLLISVPGHAAKAVASLGDVSIKTKITSHAPKTAIKLAAGNIDLFAIEEMVKTAPAGSRRARSAAEHWNLLHFARVLALTECKASVSLNNLTRPDVDVKVTRVRAKCYLCADTIAVVAALVAAATAAPEGEGKAGEPTTAPSVIEATSDRIDVDARESSGAEADILGSLDEDAFRRAAPMDSAADLVDDDVPSDPSFLGETSRYHPEIVETLLDGSDFLGGGSIASLSFAPTDAGNVVFADEDVTVRMLDAKGIRPVDNYFTDPELAARSRPSFDSSASSVRLRITDFELSLRLHSGYDWLSTRSAIEEEARKVRRRLQKIKQLLAEGQNPDDSVEAATSHLLESVHIALEHSPAEMDPSEMIRAMDEGLGGSQSDAESVSDAGTWQPVPGPGLSAPAAASDNPQPRNRHKLQRSRHSMIDFNFRGVEVDFDLLDAIERHLSSRVAVRANTFEIVDNIKTSTWHAFLTRMKDKEAAFRRDTEARMLQVEILNLRAKDESEGDEEVRMRAKIEPLRLHVDQDALDFLKRFFAFKLPDAPPPEPASASQPAKPFIQYAEIYPIKLKLDYKPKRVDYGLLKEGKTIELMNFFHFEGSEMTLRHITLRGINGWPRLFDSLNDIWTPDVKANQLADVLAGVAPIRTLVNVGSGMADLVLLPIEQYQKDKRLIRGVQRGVTSFAKTTALEAVRLGARLATGTQVILEQAEHILGGRLSQPLRGEAVGPSPATTSPAPSSLSSNSGSRSTRSGSGRSDVTFDPDSSRLRSSMAERHGYGYSSTSSLSSSEVDPSEGAPDQYSRYAEQPEDIKEALAQAYAGLSRGLTSAAQTILAVPMEVYEGGTANNGDGSVARPVVKAVPIAVLRGARGATEAFAKTLMGVQAQLGERGTNVEGKYKTRR